MNNETGEGCLVTGGRGRLATVLREYWSEASYGVAVPLTGEDTILHLAAETDVDGCERLGGMHTGEANFSKAIYSNIELTYSILKHKIPIIYASTYFCAAPGDEMGIYALSKRWGERLVQNSGVPYKIIRIGYVLDNFLDWLFKLEDWYKNNSYTKSHGLEGYRKIQPVSYHTIARVIKEELQDKRWGRKALCATYNIVTDNYTTPYDLGSAASEIPTRKVYGRTGTPRPQNTVLKSDFNIGGWKDELNREVARRKAL